MPKHKKASTRKTINKSKSKIGINLVAVFFVFFSFVFLFQIDGYKFILDRVIIQGASFIAANPNLNFAQKSAVKNGNDFRYINVAKAKTSENSTILMPSEEMIFPKGARRIFNKGSSWGIKNKAWAEYYLYPRKLLYVDELTPELMEQFDYVAIVNGLGYEYLNYIPEKKVLMDILPRVKK